MAILNGFSPPRTQRAQRTATAGAFGMALALEVRCTLRALCGEKPFKIRGIRVQSLELALGVAVRGFCGLLRPFAVP
jgi:hypothetical protein